MDTAFLRSRQKNKAQRKHALSPDGWLRRIYSSLTGTGDALSQLLCNLRSGGLGQHGFADDVDDEWIMNDGHHRHRS
jgi:hypothetical protein